MFPPEKDGFNKKERFLLREAHIQGVGPKVLSRSLRTVNPGIPREAVKRRLRTLRSHF